MEDFVIVIRNKNTYRSRFCLFAEGIEKFVNFRTEAGVEVYVKEGSYLNIVEQSATHPLFPKIVEWDSAVNIAFCRRSMDGTILITDMDDFKVQHTISSNGVIKHQNYFIGYIDPKEYSEIEFKF